MFASNQKEPLHDLLKPIKKKLFYKKLLRTVGIFTFVGIASAILFLLIARVYPISFYKLGSGILLTVSLLFGVVLVMLKKPNDVDAAGVADQFGLEERITTALNNKKNQSMIAYMQREDATSLLRRSLAKILSSIRIWCFPRKQVLYYLVAMILFSFLLIIPNPMDTVLAEKQLIEQKEEQIKKEIQKEMEKVKENKNLQEIEKKELLDKLEELQKNIAQKDLKEQLKELAKVSKELNELKKKKDSIHETLKNLSEKLAENAALKDFAQSLNNNDLQALEEARFKWNEKLAALSEDESEKLSESLLAAAKMLEEAAKELNNQDLEALTLGLQNANEQISAGNGNQIVNELNQALSEAINQSIQSSQSANQLASTIANLQQIQAVIVSGNNSSNSGTIAGNGTQSNPGQQGNSNNNTSNGSGNSSNGNQGSTGSKNSNSGTSSGTGNGGASGTGGNANGGQGGGAGLGSGTHMISVPSDRIISEGINDTVNGPLGEGSSYTTTSGTNSVSPGISLPYDSVYLDYINHVRDNLERNEIPADYQDMVRDYFSSIEP